MTEVRWMRADWPAPPGVVAGTTLRQGGASSGPYASLNLGAHVGDDADAVRTNRRLFREACRLPAEPLWLNQVHGTDVATAGAELLTPTADARVERRPNVVCAVLTADCLPVVFASAPGDEIAVAHAGWRGLCNGILEATAAEMRAVPEQLLAWLGPAISQRAFEVGGEVRDDFLRLDEAAGEHFSENERGRWQADLYGLARMRLENCGIGDISGGDHCTFGAPDDYFSYRRDAPCGRMATFVFREEP
ncbi:MAG: peptidoglycan editing factor PgeF [Woeseiaceae bacterium]